MVLDSSWYETTENFGHKGVTSFHVIAFLAGIINYILNGVIWLVFSYTPRLLAKGHLYLFYAFAITNCLTGFCTIPTFINLFIHNNFNCPRWTILLGSSFEIALDRIRAIITIAISVERLQAIFSPGNYFFMDHKKAAIRTCYFAVFWGVFDAGLLIFEDDLSTVRAHCVPTSSSGPMFHWYFLISNIISGLLLSVLYIILFCRLVVAKRSVVVLNRKMCKQNQIQANTLTIGVILLVLIFSVLPCCLYLYDMIIGEVIFMQWGPIVTIGYHCYGICSFFFYNFKHREIRHTFQIVCSSLQASLLGFSGNCCQKDMKNPCLITSTKTLIIISGRSEGSEQDVFL